MSRVDGNAGGGNVEAWFRYDAESEPLGDTLNHGDAARDNLKAAGTMARETVQELGKAFAGRSVSADSGRSVGTPVNYVANLGMALLMGTLVAPSMIVKDLADAAIHGIVAGFRNIF